MNLMGAIILTSSPIVFISIFIITFIIYRDREEIRFLERLVISTAVTFFIYILSGFIYALVNSTIVHTIYMKYTEAISIVMNAL